MELLDTKLGDPPQDQAFFPPENRGGPPTLPILQNARPAPPAVTGASGESRAAPPSPCNGARCAHPARHIGQGDSRPAKPRLAKDAWTKCPRHGAFVYAKLLKRNLNVCPECGYHFRISARARIESLCDRGSFDELGRDLQPNDPLRFVDAKPYAERIRQAQKKTGLNEAAIYGTGTIRGSRLVIAVMDFAFIGGAMGSTVGEAITRAIETAVRRRLPLLIVCASGGARMQEGCISLMQMAKTSAALTVLAQHRLPYFVLLTDPTYGGVSASFASLGDVLIAEPDAMIGFAGRSVIEATIRQKLPPEFQRTQFLMEHGMIDMIVSRSELRRTMSKLLRHYGPAESRRGQVPDALPEVARPQYVQVVDQEPDAWETVQRARNPGRPTSLQYIHRIFDDYYPLCGDRTFGEDRAIVGGVARLGHLSCMVIGTQKGRSAKENVKRSFGMPHPEGYRKALRLMRQAAKFRMPIITLVDTPGAYPGVGAEERGQSAAIAQNLFEMAKLPVPIVTVLTGEGGSGGALALSVADRVLMMEHAYFSVISPEGCSVILFKDTACAPRAARSLALTACALKRLGVIDQIVPEPGEGAHADIDATAQILKRSLVDQLRELLGHATPRLLRQRLARYRQFGAPSSFHGNHHA